MASNELDDAEAEDDEGNFGSRNFELTEVGGESQDRGREIALVKVEKRRDEVDWELAMGATAGGPEGPPDSPWVAPEDALMLSALWA